MTTTVKVKAHQTAVVSVISRYEQPGVLVNNISVYTLKDGEEKEFTVTDSTKVIVEEPKRCQNS